MNFAALGIGGADVVGPWVNNRNKMWDSLTTVAAEGAVHCSSARCTVARRGGRRIITTNDLPVHHTTGVFAIASTDPAFAYDKNPNTIAPQSISWSFPGDAVARRLQVKMICPPAARP